MTDVVLSEGQLRDLVHESFRTNAPGQFSGLLQKIANRAIEQRLIRGEEYPNARGTYRPADATTLGVENAKIVREIIWDMIASRLLVPGPPDDPTSNGGWPHLTLTELGHRVVQQADPNPYRQEAYFARIKRDATWIDPLAERYLREAMETFRQECYLASAVMLGVASERVFLLMVNKFMEGIGNQAKLASFKKKFEASQIKGKFEEFRKRLPNLQPPLPSEIADDLETFLDGIFALIRSTRNDAGHPTGKEVDRELAFANLQLFAHYYGRIWGLNQFFSANHGKIDF